MKRSHPRTDMARALRDTGLTYREIAEKMGISRQCVAQMCGKSDTSHFVKFSDAVVYPNLRKWLNENKVSMAEFIRRCGYTSVSNEYQYFSRWMHGRVDPTKRIIDACIKATGMTYEELFYQEVKEDD